jgi:sugar/nucleoside kinase (ribokinase family)
LLIKQFGHTFYDKRASKGQGPIRRVPPKVGRRLLQFLDKMSRKADAPVTLLYKSENGSMQTLFIGQTYIDITFLTDRLPTGDEKHVASDYAVSFGGNAVTAAFCCAKLSAIPDLMTTVAEDWLGRMFVDMAAKYNIMIHPRKVDTSSLSFIMPKDGKRAIVRCRDDNYLSAFPVLDLTGCRALHVDGHQADAALHYARYCREAGILTSLDGGGVRSNTHDLLAFIDVAVVAERLCEQMRITPSEMLTYLKTRGCRIGGVTCGERGLLWYDETGIVHSLTALPVQSRRIIDTSGAGDVFHGAYVYSYLAKPGLAWGEHFQFARAAAAYKIQHLGNEAGLPALADVEAIRREFPEES